MNREILFRAKAVDNTWYYGTPLLKQSELWGFALSDPQYSPLPSSYIDLDTLGQYTGLTDKYGTKVFEGDVITGLAHLGDIFGPDVVDGVVELSDVWCSFGIVSDGAQWLGLGMFHRESIGVIGNIYDNPDLIPE